MGWTLLDRASQAMMQGESRRVKDMIGRRFLIWELKQISIRNAHYMIGGNTRCLGSEENIAFHKKACE